MTNEIDHAILKEIVERSMAVKRFHAIHDGTQKILFTLCYLAAAIVLYQSGIQCVFYRLIGIPCPGCGMTHAVLALLSGHPLLALAKHPMVWSLPILWLYLMTDGALFHCRAANHALIIVLAAGFVISYAIRLCALML